MSSTGWPSFYIEEMTEHAASLQASVASLIMEGVFERFPELKIVLIEAGFGWLPALGWRLDKNWKRLKDEVPHLKRAPSEYMREHFWVSTQPMEETEDPDHLIDVMDWIGWDRIMFASDYPHWDFDDPFLALPPSLTEERRNKIYSGNAQGALPVRLMAAEMASTSSPPSAKFRPAAASSSQANGRAIVVFNLGGEFFALNNRCPHRGGSLCQGNLTGLVQSDEPGEYNYIRRGEIIRCPWHAWEFDIRTGKSWCDPDKRRARPLSRVSVERAPSWSKGPTWPRPFRSASRTTTWWSRRRGRRGDCRTGNRSGRSTIARDRHRF